MLEGQKQLTEGTSEGEEERLPLKVKYACWRAAVIMMRCFMCQTSKSPLNEGKRDLLFFF